jgi:acyl carrier protein
MTETTFSRVRRTLSDLFSLSPDAITVDTTQKDIEAWDSMGHLMFIEALEQEFETQFSPENVEAMRDLGTIVRLLGAP